ncbi:MAG TPA: hypothetical protein VNA30_01850 [Mycobacteriales bacterium]|nr:hypothetical protein [Mycobacteriales bacterium]
MSVDGGAAGGGFGVRYRRDVGPGDAGMRICLRHRLPSGQPTDVLGDLVRWTAEEVVIRRADDTLVVVTPADVLAAKRIPPPPAPR